MDRHVRWLRRRIVASIATQTAGTFTVVTLAAYALLQWRTDEGPLGSLLAAVVVAQLISLARLGHAMRNNPLNYGYMRTVVDKPFSYRVTRLQSDDEAHPAAAKLPGFAPVATIRNPEASPEPIFDIYHDPSRLTAASISRASGSVTLISSLAESRILVTDARILPPHERLVMSVAPDDSIEAIISTHQKARAGRSDVRELASSAHQVVMDTLAIEHESYCAIGPFLSSFLDLDPNASSPLRLTARVGVDELEALPVQLGLETVVSDVSVSSRTAAPTLARLPVATHAGSATPVAPLVAPEVVGPEVASVEVVEVVVAAPADVRMPQVVAAVRAAEPVQVSVPVEVAVASVVEPGSVDAALACPVGRANPARAAAGFTPPPEPAAVHPLTGLYLPGPTATTASAAFTPDGHTTESDADSVADVAPEPVVTVVSDLVASPTVEVSSAEPADQASTSARPGFAFESTLIPSVVAAPASAATSAMVLPGFDVVAS